LRRPAPATDTFIAVAELNHSDYSRYGYNSSICSSFTLSLSNSFSCVKKVDWEIRAFPDSSKESFK